jgi:hypothetical protein
MMCHFHESGTWRRRGDVVMENSAKLEAVVGADDVPELKGGATKKVNREETQDEEEEVEEKKEAGDPESEDPFE